MLCEPTVVHQFDIMHLIHSSVNIVSHIFVQCLADLINKKEECFTVFPKMLACVLKFAAK